MNLYLSSFRLGLYPAELVRLAGGRGARTAVITNATDFRTIDGTEANEREFVDLRGIGLDPHELDLRDYFGRPRDLEERLSDVKLVWVRGGNIFILRRAMLACGFDEVVKPLVVSGALTYGGYSAGICVLAPTLRGLDLVDDANFVPEGYDIPPPWGGMGLLDYCIAPHYRSDHPESHDIDRTVKYFNDNNLPYRTLQDGEVITIENGEEMIRGFESD